MRCSTCGKWELGASDSFCSWCGERVQPLALALEPFGFIAGRAANESVLTIRNTGAAGPVTIAKVSADCGWIRVDDSAARGHELGPADAPLSLEVEVDPSELADDFHAGVITVETESNGSWTEDVHVSPAPRWDIPDPQPLFLERHEKEAAVPLTLIVEKGALTLRNIVAKTDGWARVRFDESGGGVRLSSRGENEHPFQLLVDPDKMPRDGARLLLDRYEVELRLEFDEFLIESTKTVRFTCVLPPQPVVVEQAGGGVRVEAFRGETEELVLHLQNGFRGEVGRATLTVKEVRSSKGWLRLKGPELPLTVESGKAAGLAFTVDAADASLAGAGEDGATVVLEVEPAEKGKGGISLSVFARVTERPVYDGWLCIDFGTTNTCVGGSELDREGNPRLLPMDEGMRAVLSSAIQYRDLKDGIRVYAIGGSAYGELYEPTAEGTVFDQIKRKLGSDDKLNVRFLNRKNEEHEPVQKLTPREIATDIFKRLLANAEKELRAKVVRCAVSHPSRASRMQLKDLHESLVEAFKPYDIPEENIKFFHEPVAAAVDYLTTQSEAPAGEGNYHLLIYDFGGGTTDLALLRVSEKRHPRRGRIVRPEVLTVDGDPAMGGEDVTDMLMNLYHAKIEQRPAAEGQVDPQRSLRLPIYDAKETDLLMQKVARQNRAVLRRWAETEKIDRAEALLKRKDMTATLALPERLTFIVDSKPVRDALLVVDRVTKEEFNARLSEMIEPPIRKMCELLGKVGLQPEDISQVLLSGQSSAFPVVRDTIQERLRLSDDRVQQLKNPKECVVRGLCALQSDELTAGLAVMVETQGCLSAATSRLGLRVRDRGRWKFMQLIGAGTPIGSEGYTREVREVFFKRNTALPLYEHMGPEDDDNFDEADPRVRVVKVFRLPDKLAEMGEASKRITDETLFDAELWFSINDNHEVELEIRFKEEEKLAPIKFEATYGGY